MSDALDPEDGPDTAVAQRGWLRVQGQDSAGRPPVDIGRWCEVAVQVLEAEGLAGGRVDLHFVTTDDITALNVEHLDGSGATDVLSFPYEDEPRTAAAAGDPELVLGDVVVCAEVAAAQAAEHAGTFDDELALLVVHGTLHVLGWDHAEPDEALAMQQREAELLAVAGFDFVHPAQR